MLARRAKEICLLFISHQKQTMTIQKVQDGEIRRNIRVTLQGDDGIDGVTSCIRDCITDNLGTYGLIGKGDKVGITLSVSHKKPEKDEDILNYGPVYMVEFLTDKRILSAEGDSRDEKKP
jgi:hypothetical protein